MIVSAYGDGLYKLLFLGHIISLVVAFAPAAVHPVLTAQAKKDGDSDLMRLAGHMAANGRRIYTPALIALGGFGILLVLQSGDAWGFDQTWVMIAFAVWLAICAVVTAIIVPGDRKLAAGDMAAEARVALGGQIATVLVLVMLYLMIWKPGL